MKKKSQGSYFYLRFCVTYSGRMASDGLSKLHFTTEQVGFYDVQTSITTKKRSVFKSWWRHQMETFSALLALCVGNSPVIGEFPSQRSVTRSFDVFFDLCMHKRRSKQSWVWWFETPSHSSWRHRNVVRNFSTYHLSWCQFCIKSYIYYTYKTAKAW